MRQLLFIASVIFFGSCQYKVANEEVSNYRPPAATAPAANVQPSLPQTGGEVVLNPPHGQPGHDCDIEVGAPLNKPGAVAQPTTTVAPVMSVPSQPVGSVPMAPVGTVAKINPPHGQPGHRCDINVGDPLP